MAYRRRQGITRASTFKEEVYNQGDDGKEKSSNPQFTTSHSFSSSTSQPFSPRSPSDSLAAQAIRASAARRESPVFLADNRNFDFSSRSKGFNAYEDSKSAKGFWGVLARKAKAIIEDDDTSPEYDSSARKRSDMFDHSSNGSQAPQTYHGLRTMDNPTIRKSLDKLTISLNQIGDSFERAFEEGRTMVENKTADIKLQIRRKEGNNESQNQDLSGNNSTWQQQPLNQATPLQNRTNETQLKASRDVAMATAAKAKLLLRELKTVKADLAFAKERCSQLEEENKILREGREKGQNPADDDLIRLQLETLLAEKARLANENSVYARENRFLREIVEYHQLTMQDVVYLDEGEEVFSEIYPFPLPAIAEALSTTPASPTSPASAKSPTLSPPDKTSSSAAPPEEEAKDASTNDASTKDVSTKDAPPSSDTSEPKEDDAKRPSASPPP